MGMKKEEFIYLWVNIYLRISIQATLAIESYSTGTVPFFYDNLHESFDKAINVYYDMVNKGIEQFKMQAILIAYITRCRDEVIERAIDLIDELIRTRSVVDSYNVREQFRKFSEQNSNNPFLEIIKEVRSVEENRF